jgi:nucleotidyltransferase substrate binding protein (TIGR01987 family)
MSKLEAIIKQFKQALNRLDEVLKEPKNSIVRDFAIQRFEFSLDLAWKSAKAYLEDKKGITCSSPKDCFREAYRQGLIEYDDVWIKYVDMRNETVHTYKEEIADKIYAELPKALKDFMGLLKVISK